MAAPYNYVVNVTLQSANIAQFETDLKNRLRKITVPVEIKFDGSNLSELQTKITSIDISLRSIQKNAQTASQSVGGLGTSLNRLNSSAGNVSNNISKTNSTINQLGSGIENVSVSVDSFSRRIELATRRFGAFVVAASAIFTVLNAIKGAISASLEFERGLVRLEQVGNDSSTAIGDLTKQITQLSTTLGVSSKELLNASVTLRQAGLSLDQVKQSLESIAKTSLSPTFGSIEQTVEGVIAIFSQFKISAQDLEKNLSAINAVAAGFAVESKDIIEAVKRAGGVFQAAGGNLQEFLALFTAIRSTTRESADTIATGMRTIFGRLQRPETIEQLKSLNIELRYTQAEAARLGNINLTDKFVGPYESILRINEALKEISPNDLRFAKIAETIGGYRQLSRVIPLLKETAKAQEALTVAQYSNFSLTVNAEQAQQAFLTRLERVKEGFLALFRTIGQSQSFQFFLDTIERGISLITKFGEALTPLLPLITAFATVKLAQGIFGVTSSLASGRGNKVLPFSHGGIVPGVGNTDSVPAILQPGEFVVNKTVAQSIGYNKLARMNRRSEGDLIDEANSLVKFYSEHHGVDFAKHFNKIITFPSDMPGEEFTNAFITLGTGADRNIQLRYPFRTTANLQQSLFHEIGHGVDYPKDIIIPFSARPGHLFNEISDYYKPIRISQLNANKSFNNATDSRKKMEYLNTVTSNSELFADAFSMITTYSPPQLGLTDISFVSRYKHLLELLRGDSSLGFLKSNVIPHIGFASGGSIDPQTQAIREFSESVIAKFASTQNIDFRKSFNKIHTFSPSSLQAREFASQGLKDVGGYYEEYGRNIFFPQNFLKANDFNKTSSILHELGHAVDFSFGPETIKSYSSISDSPFNRISSTFRPIREDQLKGLERVAIKSGHPFRLKPDYHLNNEELFADFFMNFLQGSHPGSADYIGKFAQKDVFPLLRNRFGPAKFAHGGQVDNVPALLTPGEFVVNRESAQQIGTPTLRFMNQTGRVPGFNKGGFVGMAAGDEPQMGIVRQTLRNLTTAISNSFKLEVGLLTSEIQQLLRTAFRNLISNSFINTGVLQPVSGSSISRSPNLPAALSPSEISRTASGILPALNTVLNRPLLSLEAGTGGIANLNYPAPGFVGPIRPQHPDIQLLSRGQLPNIINKPYNIPDNIQLVEEAVEDQLFNNRKKAGRTTLNQPPSADLFFRNITRQEAAAPQTVAEFARATALVERTHSLIGGEDRDTANNKARRLIEQNLEAIAQKTAIQLQILDSTLIDEKAIQQARRYLSRQAKNVNVAFDQSGNVLGVSVLEKAISNKGNTLSEVVNSRLSDKFGRTPNNFGAFQFSTQSTQEESQKVAQDLVKVTTRAVLGMEKGIPYEEAKRIAIERVTIGLKRNEKIITDVNNQTLGFVSVLTEMKRAGKEAATGFQTLTSKLRSGIKGLGGFDTGILSNLGFGALIGGQYLAEFLQRGAGTAQEAVTKKNEFGFTAASVASGGIIGGTIGATVGGAFAQFSNKIPIAGAILGAGLGVVDALNEVNKQISQAKLDEAIIALTGKIKDFAAGFDTADIVIGIDKDFKSVFEQINKKAADEATTLVNGFNVEVFRSVRQKLLQQQLGPQLVPLVTGLSKAATTLGKSRPTENLDTLTEEFLNRGDRRFRRNIETLAEVNRSDVNKEIENVKKLIKQGQEEENVRKKLIELEKSLSLILNNFNRLAIAAEQAAISTEIFDQKTEVLTQQFEGRFGAISVNTLANRFKVPGTPEFGQAITQVGGILGSSGKGLVNQLEVGNTIEGTLTEILIQAFKESELKSETFARRFRSLAGNVGAANPLFDKALVDIATKIDVITKKDEKFLENLESSPQKIVDELLRTTKESSIENARVIQTTFNKAITDLASGLAQSRQFGQTILEEKGKGADLELQRKRLEAQEASFKSGVPALNLLSLQDLLGPFTSRQRNLGAAGLSSEEIVKQLDNVNKEIEKQVNIQQNAANLGNKVGFKQASLALNELQRQAQNLGQALKNLADPTSRLAAINEKLSIIEQDRAARISIGENFLTSNFGDRAKLNQGVLLLAQARQQGNFNGLTPEATSLAVGAGRRFGNAVLPAFGGVTGNALIDQLIRQSGFNIKNVAEEEDLKKQKLGVLGESQRTQAGIITGAETVQKQFFDNLLQKFDTFFTNLSLRLQEKDILLKKAEKTQLEIKGVAVDAQTKQIQKLSEFGVTSDKDLEKIRAKLPLFEKFQNNISRSASLRKALGLKFFEPDTFTRNVGNTREDFALNVEPKLRKALLDRGTAQSDVDELLQVLTPGLSKPGQIGGRQFRISPFASEKEILARRSELAQQFLEQTIIDQLAKSKTEALATNLEIEKAGFKIPKGFEQGKGEESLKLIREFHGKIDGSNKILEDFNKEMQTLTQLIKDMETNLEIQKFGFPKTQINETIENAIPSLSDFFAHGGYAKGKGTDIIPAMLSPGEFIVNRESALANKSILEHINKKKGPLYAAEGGIIGDLPRTGGGLNFDELKKRQQIAQLVKEREKQKIGAPDVPAIKAAPKINFEVIDLIQKFQKDADQRKQKAQQQKQADPFIDLFIKPHLEKLGKEKAAGIRGIPNFEDIGDFVDQAVVGATNKLAIQEEAQKQAIVNPAGASAFGINRAIGAQIADKSIPNIKDDKIFKILNPQAKLPFPDQAARQKQIDFFAESFAQKSQDRAIQSDLSLRQALVQSAGASLFTGIGPSRNEALAQANLASSSIGLKDQPNIFAQPRPSWLGPQGQLIGPPVDGSGRRLSPNEIVEVKKQYGFFASGGAVPGIGNSDSVPSLLTPGEYVLNKDAVQKFGIANLERMNRFQTGGPVGTSASLDISGLKTSIVDFGSNVSILQSTINEFNKTAVILGEAMRAFPAIISIEGHQTVEVLINGAEVLNNIIPEIRNIAKSQIKEAISKLAKDNFGEAGISTEDL